MLGPVERLFPQKGSQKEMSPRMSAVCILMLGSFFFFFGGGGGGSSLFTIIIIIVIIMVIIIINIIMNHCHLMLDVGWEGALQTIVGFKGATA